MCSVQLKVLLYVLCKYSTDQMIWMHFLWSWPTGIVIPNTFPSFVPVASSSPMSWRNLHWWNFSEHIPMDSCIFYHQYIHMISSVSNHVCTLHMFEKNYVHIPDADCMIDHYINDSFHQLVWFHFLCQDTLDKSCNAPEATAFFASLGLCCTARKMASCGGKLCWSTGWNKHALCVGLIGIW